MEKNSSDQIFRRFNILRYVSLFGALGFALALLFIGLGLFHVQSAMAFDNNPPLLQDEHDPPGGHYHEFEAWKTSSPHTVFPDEILTYTIALQNNQDKPVTATVSDAVPAAVITQDGSVSSGGQYDSASQTILWENVVVPSHQMVRLTFLVKPAAVVVSPTLVTNTATITYDLNTIERTAWSVLVPEGWICPILDGSYKSASQRSLAPDEMLTYTIVLHNNGGVNTVADVTDPLPKEVALVEGTVDGGGVYDPISHTLTWSGVSVPAHGEVSLSFGVSQGITVTAPMKIRNKATITSAGKTIYRSVETLLLPSAEDYDFIPPRVNSVIIDEQDVLTSPTVTLHISATDNMSVTWMYIREWRLLDEPKPRWRLRFSSGWLPYQSEYTWTLKEQSGVHFVGVWVADANFNRSRLTRHAIDFASLILPGETLPKHRYIPYLVNYEAGQDVQAVVTPTVGDVDLFVWYPHDFGWPNQYSAHTGTVSEVVTFTTPESGPYIFLVYGREETTYDMIIRPAGGQAATGHTIQGISDETQLQSPDEPSNLLYEPLFTQSGSDVLGAEGSDTPGAPGLVYLPIMVK